MSHDPMITALPTVTFHVGLHVQYDGTGHRMVFLTTADEAITLTIARDNPYPGLSRQDPVFRNMQIRPDMPGFKNATEAHEWVSKNLWR